MKSVQKSDIKRTHVQNNLCLRCLLFHVKVESHVTFSFLCISLTQHEATQAWLAGLEPAVSSVFALKVLVYI